jgi:hypothetical protein
VSQSGVWGRSPQIEELTSPPGIDGMQTPISRWIAA